jgi:2-methylisocitrate lyase-like PEP mutase family enzyme
MTEIAARAARFVELHRSGCFVLPNAWDAGSARILAGMGPVALATTSAGAAWAIGKRDGGMSRAEALANAAAIIAEAGALPVSADLEDGYGPDPEACAETVRAAAATGLVGCTIEDTTRNPAAPIHGFDAAVARVKAAVAAARALPHGFVLTARTENFLHGRPDLDDTIRRLVAFAEAGAECLYAPALPDMDAVRKVVAAVAPKPVNVLYIPRPGLLPLAEFAAAGVRRVSLGGGLARVAYSTLFDLGPKLIAGEAPGLPGIPSPQMNGAMRPLDDRPGGL